MIIDGFNEAGIIGKILMLVPVIPLIFGLAYAIRPSERRLALMRPLSLAAIFAAVGSIAVGLIVILQGIAVTGTPDWNRVALGAAESLVPTFSGFACLTIAWILVAIGMTRTA